MTVVDFLCSRLQSEQGSEGTACLCTTWSAGANQSKAVACACKFVPLVFKESSVSQGLASERYQALLSKQFLLEAVRSHSLFLGCIATEAKSASDPWPGRPSCGHL